MSNDRNEKTRAGAGRQNPRLKKHYVEMVCYVDTAGQVTPQRLVWGDGRSWEIGCVLQALESPFEEYRGVRYTVLIGSAVRNIYRDHDQWYVLSEN